MSNVVPRTLTTKTHRGIRKSFFDLELVLHPFDETIKLDTNSNRRGQTKRTDNVVEDKESSIYGEEGFSTVPWLMGTTVSVFCCFCGCRRAFWVSEFGATTFEESQ